jgi:hypothetical protein
MRRLSHRKVIQLHLNLQLMTMMTIKVMVQLLPIQQRLRLKLLPMLRLRLIQLLPMLRHLVSAGGVLVVVVPITGLDRLLVTAIPFNRSTFAPFSNRSTFTIL